MGENDVPSVPRSVFDISIPLKNVSARRRLTSYTNVTVKRCQQNSVISIPEIQR